MKIFLISDNYPPVTGGIETYAYDLVESLKKKKIDVEVFTRDANRNDKKIVEVPFINFPYLKGPSFIFFLIFYLMKELLKEEPDIIHTNSFQPTIAALIAKNLLRKKTPIIMTAPGLTSLSAGFKQPRIVRKVIVLMEKVSTKNCNFIISIDKYFIQHVTKFYKIKKEKIRLIPLGVDTNLFSKSNADKLIRKKLGIENKFVILCTRRLVVKNTLEYAIRAFAIVTKKIKNAILIFVGDGPYKNTLVRLAKKLHVQNKVIFVGAKPKEQIPYYINSSDVVLLPSKVGNFNFSLLEAWACQKITVATKSGNTLDFSEVNPSTLILCEQSPKDIARGLQRIFENKYNVKSITSNALKVIKNKYSLQKMVDDTMEVYKFIISKQFS